MCEKKPIPQCACLLGDVKEEKQKNKKTKKKKGEGEGRDSYLFASFGSSFAIVPYF